MRTPSRLTVRIEHFVGDRLRHFARPSLQDDVRRLVGQRPRPEHARQSRDEDQEREHRHQDRKRDVARDRPRVVQDEAVVGDDEDFEGGAQPSHGVLSVA